MTRILLLLAAILAPALVSQTAQPPQTAAAPNPAFYLVAYVEVADLGPSRTRAIAAFNQYRNASRSLDGFVSIAVFEQAGRPGHFAVVERWREQGAFDARDPAPRKQFLEALGSIRISDFDQRPYKTLTVESPLKPVQPSAVHIITHVDVSPGPQPPLLLQRLAEASRPEQGNLGFDVLQHTMRANHFTVIETWESKKALDAHVSAPHTKKYREDLGPLTGSPLDERLYQAVR